MHRLSAHSVRRPPPIATFSLSQHRTTASLQFYRNRQLELYAAKKANRLSLRQLVFFGRSMSEERLIKSANYVRKELPIRISHRLRDLQNLPYVVVTQPEVARVYELYWSAFEKFRNRPPIETLKDNEDFCLFLRGLLNEHLPVIPTLSLGLSLSSHHLPPEQLDTFMRRMLVSRISRRVLAEHHIALSEGFANRGSETEDHVGLIYTGLDLKATIEHCAKLLRKRPLEDLGTRETQTSWPDVVIDGDVNTTFSYIKEHLSYIIFELLKNSMFFTARKNSGVSPQPSIRATIVSSPDDVHLRISDQGGGLLTSEVNSPSDLFSFSHVRNSARLADDRLVALRQSSASEKGHSATVDEQVDRWNNGTADQPKEAAHPRMGLGLPMANVFATYFGGSLDLVSLDGWGTDVYLRLPKLGTNLEGIEV